MFEKIAKNYCKVLLYLLYYSFKVVRRMDTDDLILQILGDKIRSNTYTDEPILRTAAHMKNYMPPQYREMRKVALQNGRRQKTPAEIFVEQGRLMADFEDDYEYTGEFVRYFPTYQSMSDSQLRGYFSWRTQVRRGNIRKTSASFVYVYIYELLNCIGVSSPLEGFQTLKSFYTEYRKLDMQIERYVQMWLRDFVVYYDLDVALLEDQPISARDASLSVLIEYATQSDDVLYAAICALSSYNPDNSRFTKHSPGQMRQAVCAVYRTMADYYEKNRKYSLCEAYFGRNISVPHVMFSSALFCPQGPQPDRTVQVTPLCRYTCRHGKWTCKRIWSAVNRSADLGAVMKATDRLLRERTNYSYKLKADKTPKYILKLIERALDACEQAQRQKAVAEVKIDLSKLQNIRDAAEVTRERLIVEEEVEDEPTAPEPLPEPETPTNDCPLDLSEAEYTVLRGLLLGEDVQSYLRQQGLLLSVVAESINEKCFDLFSDTVLLFDGDTPEVIEDYTEELKGMMNL